MNLDNFMGYDGLDFERKKAMYQSMPLVEYVQMWLDVFKAGSIKPASLSRLKISASTLQKNKIAQIPIGNITPIDIQRYINELAAEGYAINTIKKQLLIVTAPLKHAASMRFIQFDPSAGVHLPQEDKLTTRTKKIEPYTVEEQDRLWKYIDSHDHPGVLAIGFMLETGLRAGELLALRWDKVDIERKRITVDATIINPSAYQRASYQQSPKSKSSNRIIPLTPRAISILERLKEKNTQWVFPGRNGKWLSYENLAKHIKQACKNAHVQYRGAHAFRHTFATNCYYRNMDVKILSKLLGHSDISVTMNIYVSLRGDGFDEMYNALIG